MIIPVLRTERLLLRAQRPDDTGPLTRAFADDHFSRFITREGRGLNAEEAWRPIALVPGGWIARGYSQFIVEETATGEPVGRVGPWHPEGWPDFEIGWAIFPWRQGQGYALEAAAASMVWAREALGRDHVIHLIDPANTASEGVARALGAELTGSWAVPDRDEVNIWTTRWERFAETKAHARHVAAAAGRP